MRLVMAVLQSQILIRFLQTLCYLKVEPHPVKQFQYLDLFGAHNQLAHSETWVAFFHLHFQMINVAFIVRDTIRSKIVFVA